MADEKGKRADSPQASEKSKKLSDKQKADAANVAISILDSQVATWLREKVAPRTPEWMRSPAARQLAGPFRALIEAVTDDKHWLIKTFGEKVGSDYLDMLFTILGGEPEKAAGDGKKVTSRFEDFLKHANKRLLEAEDPDAEWERLKKRFDLRRELEAMIEEARKAEEQEPGPSTTEEKQPLELKTKLWGTKEEPGAVRRAGRTTVSRTGAAADSATRPLNGLSDRLEQRARRKGRI